MSTYSNLKLEEITLGDSGWGTATTNNILAIQQALQTATLATADFTGNSYTAPWTNSSTTLNTPRAMCLNVTATLSGSGTVNLPAISGGKLYLAINNSTGGGFAVTFKVTGLTGVSVPFGKAMWLYNNGTDIVDAVSYMSSLSLGTALPLTSGGTGATTQQAAINALTGTQTSGRYLRSDGTNASLTTIQAADVPTLNQNTTGTAAGLSATLVVASGGTGATTASGARTNLGLGTMATQDSSNISVTGGAVSGTSVLSRVVAIANGISVTINADTTDIATQTNTQAAGALTMNAPTGTPVNGQKLLFRLTSSYLQTFSWNAIFTGSSDLPLPSAGSGSGGVAKTDYMGFIYNSTAAKWQLVGKVFGF